VLALAGPGRSQPGAGADLGVEAADAAAELGTGGGESLPRSASVQQGGAEGEGGALAGLVMDSRVGPEGDGWALREAAGSLVRAVRSAEALFAAGRHEALRDAAMAADVGWAQPAAAWEALLARVAAGGEGGGGA
jgi:hypothetical protein